jgi:hypothetical protein
MQPVNINRLKIDRYVASAWNHWQIPAPMMIMDRPLDCSALLANSRAARMHASAGTLVISACPAGVYGVVGSS